jgi:hypothetical protein
MGGLRFPTFSPEQTRTNYAADADDSDAPNGFSSDSESIDGEALQQEYLDLWSEQQQEQEDDEAAHGYVRSNRHHHRHHSIDTADPSTSMSLSSSLRRHLKPDEDVVSASPPRQRRTNYSDNAANHASIATTDASPESSSPSSPSLHSPSASSSGAFGHDTLARLRREFVRHVRDFEQHTAAYREHVHSAEPNAARLDALKAEITKLHAEITKLETQVGQHHAWIKGMQTAANR